MEKIVRILLLGICGYGSNYIQEISQRRIPGVKIEGICEVLPHAADLYPIIQEQQIPIYATPEEFYREHTADLAVIATPIHLHYRQIICCLEHGSHVLSEKPVCTSVAGARRLEALAQRTGHFVAVGYQLNYARDVLQLKQDILNGRFGKPVSMKALHAMRRGDKYYSRNGWAGRIVVGNCAVNDSPFNNACAHQFQVMTFLLGEQINQAIELKDIQAELYRANRHIENYDVAALQVTTVSNVPIRYYTAHALEDQKLGPMAEYRFEAGTVYYGRQGDPEGAYVYEGKNGERIDYSLVPKGERMQKLYDALQAVRTGQTPVCTVQCAIPHLQAVEAASKMPIRQIPESWVQDITVGDDTFHAVRNLRGVLEECYRNQRMPSQVGFLENN